MKPFVKWAGGKRQISPRIMEIIDAFAKIDSNNYTYYEPFIGGGAIFFALSHGKAVINDMNSELINCYHVIKEHPYELMDLLDEHKQNYVLESPNYYYDIRKLDREPDKYKKMTNIQKAARTIFLNKTCYNGLYRVNLKGEFNTPAGRYKNPKLYDKNNILEISKFLKTKNVQILNTDYSQAISSVSKGDIIYIDPPYDYEKDGFTQYQKEGFSFEDFKVMKQHLDECIKKGAFVIISNNATDRVIKLFEEDPRYQVLYDMQTFKTQRSISSKGKTRNNGHEVIIISSPLTFPQANSINKVMSLIKIKEPKNLNNVDVLKNLLNVKTYRQVQYYIMALRYLGIIDHKKQFSKFGKNIRSLNSKAFGVELATHIRNMDIFKEIYLEEQSRGFFLTIEEIAHLIRRNNIGFSDSTYRRRASTAAKWLEWCRSTLDDY
jgi:DNA adenine methylase